MHLVFNILYLGNVCGLGNALHGGVGGSVGRICREIENYDEGGHTTPAAKVDKRNGYLCHCKSNGEYSTILQVPPFH